MEKNKNVPPLRFKGFVEDWVENKLEEIAPLQRGFDLPTQLLADGYIPVVYSNGILNYHKEAKCKGPGVITGRSGTIGKFTYIKDGEYWPHNTTLWVTDFKGNVPNFIYYLYHTIDIIQFSTGSGVPTLNRNDVHVKKAAKPIFDEQQQIGNYFQNIDKLIEANQTKLEKLNNIKKACLEKMFPKKGVTTPEIRFKGFIKEWEKCELRDACIIRTGYPFDSIDFYENGIFRVITNGNIQDTSAIVDNSVGNKIDIYNKQIIDEYVLNIGDILVTMDGTVGRTAKVNDKQMVLAQRVGRLIANDDDEFLYQLLNVGSFHKEMTIVSVGGTIKHISLPDIGDYLTYIPTDTFEQEKIGNFFKNLDNLINKNEQQLTKLKNIKKACLERMFVNKEDAQ